MARSFDYGSVDPFRVSMSRASAAAMLARCPHCRKPSVSRFVDTFTKRMRDGPAFSEDRLIATCLRKGGSHYATLAVLLAVHFGKVEQVLDSTRLRLVARDFQEAILDYLVRRERWSCVQKLLPVLPCAPHGRLLLRASWSPIEQAVDTFRQLLARASLFPRVVLQEMVCRVFSSGAVPQCRLLLRTDNATLRQVMSGENDDILHFLAELVLAVCKERDRAVFRSAENRNYIRCLRLTHEAGLLSVARPRDPVWEDEDEVFATPVGLAVYQNQPDLVRFLYRQGLASDQEVSCLLSHRVLVARASADDDDEEESQGADDEEESLPNQRYPSKTDGSAARSIVDFLSSVSSTPRSLKYLALLELSRAVGWGPRRQRNIDQLSVPLELKVALTSSAQTVDMYF